MKKLKWLGFVSLLALATSCSHHKVRIDPPAAPPKEGEVSMRFDWIKVKGAKYDLQLAISNGTDDSILFYLNDMKCFKGTVRGDLKHSFFNTGHRTFKFSAGGQGKYNMVCSLGSPAEGAFRIEIAKVYANPAHDGKTAGKLLAENIAVTQADK